MYWTYPYQNINLFPILHSKIEIAGSLGNFLLEEKPDCLAVELPPQIKTHLETAIRLLPVITVIVMTSKDRALYFLIEPSDPFIAALYLGQKQGMALHYLDLALPEYTQTFESYPDTFSMTQLTHQGYFNAFFKHHKAPLKNSLDLHREQNMAFKLNELGGQFTKICAVVGARHLPGLAGLLPTEPPQPFYHEKIEEVFHYQVNPDHLGEVTSEIPALQWVFFQKLKEKKPLSFDRLVGIRDLVRSALPGYEEKSAEPVKPWQLQILHRFALKYSRQGDKILPDLMELTTSARAAVNDAFASALWEKGQEYPPQLTSTGLPMIDLRAKDLFFGTRKLALRPLSAIPFKRMKKPGFIRSLKKESKPGEWKKNFSPDQMCSHQPEDLIIENFGSYLKKRARQILDHQNARTEPFETSLKDGLDLKETIRNWPTEKKIFVKEARPNKGMADNLVIIFEEDSPKKYPFKMTWIGEHSQESDMAFYSTPPGELMMGPGVSRCKYGGLVMTYPPQRLYDVWSDPFLSYGTQNGSEVLLMAALDYSMEKFVVYVAEKPPRSLFKSVAARYHKKILYVPIGQLSPPLLEKIRIFHILQDHSTREIARDFIP